MAHYAFLDENNVVTEIIPGVDENITQTDVDGTQVGGSTEAWETFYGNLRNQVCKRTSFNTIRGRRWTEETNSWELEGAFRKNYAQVGGTYNEQYDGFIRLKPYPSWILDEPNCAWNSPVPEPDDEFQHVWDEETLSWIIINDN